MTPSIQAHLRRRATPILLLAMALDAAALNPLAMATDFLKPLGIGGVARVPCPDSVKQVLDLDATKLHAIKDQMLLQMAQGLTDSEASPPVRTGMRVGESHGVEIVEELALLMLESP